MNLSTEIIGKRFGQLLVDAFIYYDKKHYHYVCKCDCGGEHTTTRNALLTNKVTRCIDCSNLAKAKSQIVNGAVTNRYTYNSYRSMILRCSEHARYINVPVCSEWLDPINGFMSFMNDMGERPLDHTIDRIDNSKGYSKDNCRWATSGVQNHNKKKPKNAKGKYKGVTVTDRGIIVNFYYNGKRHPYVRFNDELSAATYYDNLSEFYYGDRPNCTAKADITPIKKKFGSISYCTKSKKFKVRVHDMANKRVTVGYYEQLEEAEEVLEFLRSLKQD